MFPEWAQETYWDRIDTQRACKIIATETKKAIQVNLDKANGGVRPITLLEESLKAVEGPVASRQNKEIQKWPTGNVYPPVNISSKIKKRAASDVLQTNALVYEDTTKHKRPLCRSPTDYEKNALGSQTKHVHSPQRHLRAYQLRSKQVGAQPRQ